MRKSKRIATERVFELLRKLQKINSDTKASIEKIKGNVTLKCSFSYPQEKK
jgi:hypothetical protein